MQQQREQGEFLTEALVMTETRLPLSTERAAAVCPGGLPSKMSAPIVTSCSDTGSVLLSGAQTRPQQICRAQHCTV